MTIVQSIDSALEKNIGKHGIADGDLSATLARAERALDWLRARYADGGLPLLRLAGKHDDLHPIKAEARRLADGATDIVLLGTGGSSLGGQTLTQLACMRCPAQAPCDRRRACISWTISIRTLMRCCWKSCRTPPRASSPFRNPAALRKL
ncbi:MAG: hypothetical protein WDN48_18000 [Pseudolabrys sp.]